MKKIFCVTIIICLQLNVLTVSATDSTGIKLLYNKERISDAEVLLTIKAIIPHGIKLFGLQKNDTDALYSNYFI
jgi:thiol:disulfide interchange protein DsbD